MYAEYADQINEDNLYYDQVERTSDIQLPSVVNILLLGGWLVICLVGFAIIFFAKNIVLGITVIGIPTFIGMVIKPTFALCVLMLVLPTGAGVGYAEIFSLDRGVGIIVAISFGLNLLITHPRLHVRNKALWVLAIYTIWVFFASLAAPYVGLELRLAFTQFQLLVLVFIVYWILETNSERTFIWALRAYMVGTLGMIGFAYITGAEMKLVVEEARYAVTFGRTINPNILADLTVMAFLAAIYLFARDKHIFWRIIYLIAIVFLPVMVLKTGSRGGLIALVFTILSPLLFLRQVARKPALAALLLLVIVFASGSAAFFVQKRSLEKGVSKRLTDVQYAKESISYRVFLVKESIKAAAKRPTGTSYYGWFERAELESLPHVDLFFILGIYGFAGALLFIVFVILMLCTIRRIPMGLEKLYARAVLTYFLVAGLSHVRVSTKYYWVFLAVVMASERIAKFYMPTSDLETTVHYDEDSLIQD